MNGDWEMRVIVGGFWLFLGTMVYGMVETGIESPSVVQSVGLFIIAMLAVPFIFAGLAGIMFGLGTVIEKTARLARRLNSDND